MVITPGVIRIPIDIDDYFNDINIIDIISCMCYVYLLIIFLTICYIIETFINFLRD